MYLHSTSIDIQFIFVDDRVCLCIVYVHRVG